MAKTDSQLRRARAMLVPLPAATVNLAGITAAAAFFALSALALAVTVVMTPTPWPT